MSRGGQRKGAGRPSGTGKFTEPTKALRVPQSAVSDIYRHIEHNFYKLPLYQHAVSAGFPSPADDGCQDRLDLNELLIRHPSATFFLRVSGHSMINAGIHHDDILIVDRSIEPQSGKIVIASVNGELTVKRLIHEKGKIWLAAENPAYQPIDITEEVDLRIWGVVIHVIHSLYK